MKTKLNNTERRLIQRRIDVLKKDVQRLIKLKKSERHGLKKMQKNMSILKSWLK